MIARILLASLLALPVCTSAQVRNPNPGAPIASSAPQASTSGTEPKTASKWLVTAECRMVVVPESAALGLIPKLTSRVRSADGWAEIEKMIAEGQAKLSALLVLTTPSGEGVTSQTAEELRYPTEYDPPKLPDRIPENQALEILSAWPAVSITPTAYETRNVGPELEFVPSVNDDGTTVQCCITATHVRFVRWQAYIAGTLPNGERLSVEQPIFHSMNSRADVTLRNGQTLLLGIHKVPAPEEGYELFIFKVSAERTEQK